LSALPRLAPSEGIAAAAKDPKPVGVPTSERHRMNVIRGEVGRLVWYAVEPWAHVAVCADPGINKSFPLAPTGSRTPPRHGLADRRAPAISRSLIRWHDSQPEEEPITRNR
jgi:hypothetical protein